MFILLGFLAATFLALLMVPALNARADRLARRRLEAQLPRSLVELNAERDHLRAQLALRERRVEERLERTLAGKQADMAELGRRALRIDTLGRDLAARDARIADLDADLAKTRSTLAETQDDLTETRGDLADTREAFTQLKTAQADLQGRHDRALQDVDAKRIAIADLETRVAVQTQRGDELDKRLAQRSAELAAERTAHGETRAALGDEQARGEVLERRFAQARAEADAKSAEAAALGVESGELRQERDLARAIGEDANAALAAAQAAVARLEARVESLVAREKSLAGAHESALRALNERIEVLKAEKGSLEGALSLARQERARAQGELAALRAARPGSARGGPKPQEEPAPVDGASLERRAEAVEAEVKRAAARRSASEKAGGAEKGRRRGPGDGADAQASPKVAAATETGEGAAQSRGVSGLGGSASR